MPDPLVYLIIFFALGILIAILFWPDKGIISFWLRSVRNNKRIVLEDALKFIQHCKFHNHHATLHGLSGALKISPDSVFKLLNQMTELDLIKVEENEIHLTAKGFDYALRITRAHRLWEEFLAQETSLPFEEFHRQADKVEHTITDKELEELALQLGNPCFDPHGDPIPTASGKMKQMEGSPLTDLPENQTLRITHLEDEPEEVYAQLIAEGLHPGMVIYLVEKNHHRYRFWSRLGEHILTPVIAANISASPIYEAILPQKRTLKSLSELALGDKAKIKRLSPLLRNVERRRLMDLGFIPGTIVEANLRSAHGDPTAYRIRGSQIALRKEQTNLIEIEKHYSGEKDLVNV